MPRLGSIALVLFLAGCLGASDAPLPAPEGAVGSTELPPGCDASRPGVAHRAGGIPVESGARAIPCFVDTGAMTGEPTLGVSPSSGAVFFFPAVDSRGNVHRDGAAVAISADEGASWSRATPGPAGRGLHLVDFDPYFFLDATTGRIFADNLATVNCSILSWSDDEGASWTTSLSGCMETDHQTLFAGPPISSVTVGYPNVVYRCAMNTVALSGGSTTSTCQRSLDGGATWLPPGEPAYVTVQPSDVSYCDGAVGHGVVDAAGRVYLPKGLCGEPWLAWSDDEGLTWSRAKVSDLGMHREPDGYPGHDAGVALDADGNLYYYWIAEDRLPYLMVSRDRGATWSAPAMVGAPGLREATLPAVVAGAAGEVAFLYLGSENSPGAPFPESECTDVVCIGQPPQPEGYEAVTWNGYIGMTRNALDAEPVYHTIVVNDPADPLVRGSCGAGGCQGVLDFLDVALGPDGSAWGAFVDTCVTACVEGPGTQDNAAQGVVGRLWWG